MAVAEQLLEDILKQAQLSNTHLANLLRASAGTGGGSGSAGGLAASAGRAATQLNLLTSATNAISSVFSKIGALTGIFANFARSAAEGTAKLSDFYKAMSDVSGLVPIVGGLLKTVFDFFGQIVKYQEGLLTVYQDLTRSGASFSGNLFEMRRAAYEAYMTMGEFSKVIKDNSSLFATAIGGIDQGAKFFAASQRQLIDPNSELGRSIAGLGLTFTDASESLTTFMNMQGNMSKLNQMGAKGVAEATGGLIKQLDAYAKITGQSREDQEKALKDKKFDEQKKAFLSSLNPTQLAQANAALAAALEQGGKGLEDEVAVRLMTNNMVRVAGTEASNMLRTTTGNISDNVADVLASLVNYKLGSAEAVAALQKSRMMLADSTGRMMDLFGGPGMAGFLNFNNAVNFANEQMRTFNRVQAERGNREKTAEEITQEAFERQQKQYQGNAAALQAAQLQIKMFGAAIGTSFLGLIEKLSGPISKLSDYLLKGFSEVVLWLTEKDGPMDKLGGLLESLTREDGPIDQLLNWFQNTVRDLSESKSLSEFWDKLYKRMSNAIGEMWDRMRPSLQSHFEILLDRLWQSLKDFITGGPAKRLAELDATIEKRKQVYISNATTAEEGIQAFESSQEYKNLMASRQDFLNQIEQREVGYSAAQQRREEEIRNLVNAIRDREGKPPIPRHSGTLGMTGSWWEKENKVVEVQAGETVATPTQLAQIINSAGSNGVPEAMMSLNRTMESMLATMKRVESNTKETGQAIRSLNQDAFQMV